LTIHFQLVRENVGQWMVAWFSVHTDQRRECAAAGPVSPLVP
jgi:hypothetical protein